MPFVNQLWIKSHGDAASCAALHATSCGFSIAMRVKIRNHLLLPFAKTHETWVYIPNRNYCWVMRNSRLNAQGRLLRDTYLKDEYHIRHGMPQRSLQSIIQFKIRFRFASQWAPTFPKRRKPRLTLWMRKESRTRMIRHPRPLLSHAQNDSRMKMVGRRWPPHNIPRSEKKANTQKVKIARGKH